MAVQAMRSLFEFEKPTKGAYAWAVAAIMMKIVDGCRFKVRDRRLLCSRMYSFLSCYTCADDW